jgi:hypothetical protein
VKGAVINLSSPELIGAKNKIFFFLSIYVHILGQTSPASLTIVGHKFPFVRSFDSKKENMNFEI